MLISTTFVSSFTTSTSTSTTMPKENTLKVTNWTKPLEFPLSRPSTSSSLSYNQLEPESGLIIPSENGIENKRTHQLDQFPDSVIGKGLWFSSLYQPEPSTSSSSTSASSDRSNRLSPSSASISPEGTSSRGSLRREAPFSIDEEAILERNACDYSIKIDMETAKAGKAPRKVRVYADGIYDLFHMGHAKQLKQAKNAFSSVWLIVGVNNDKMTHSLKGKTVMNEEERYEAVRFCCVVDEVIRDAPWIVTKEFLIDNKIDFVAHDDEPYSYPGGQEDVYALLKSDGMFLPTKRSEGVSTSDLVARIVKDYDIYVRRNLARGYTAKEMNVSFINEKKFLLQNKMDELKGKFEEVRHEFIQTWEDKSRDSIGSFLDLFGRQGTLNHLWSESKGRLQRALSPPPSP